MLEATMEVLLYTALAYLVWGLVIVPISASVITNLMHPTLIDSEQAKDDDCYVHIRRREDWGALNKEFYFRTNYPFSKIPWVLQKHVVLEFLDLVNVNYTHGLTYLVYGDVRYKKKISLHRKQEVPQ